MGKLVHSGNKMFTFSSEPSSRAVYPRVFEAVKADISSGLPCLAVRRTLHIAWLQDATRQGLFHAGDNRGYQGSLDVAHLSSRPHEQNDLKGRPPPGFCHCTEATRTTARHPCSVCKSDSPRDLLTSDKNRQRACPPCRHASSKLRRELSVIQSRELRRTDVNISRKHDRVRLKGPEKAVRARLAFTWRPSTRWWKPIPE